MRSCLSRFLRGKEQLWKLRRHNQFAILSDASAGAFSTLYLITGGRAFGPPLCRGCAPATPPSKTIAHRPCLRIPAVTLHQPGRRQPNRQSDSLNGGSDKGLVKTGTVYGLAVSKYVFSIPEIHVSLWKTQQSGILRIRRCQPATRKRKQRSHSGHKNNACKVCLLLRLRVRILTFV